LEPGGVVPAADRMGVLYDSSGGARYYRRHGIACVPPGFIPPCLPSPAERVPSGPGWIYEIKHDGFRMMVRRDGRPVVAVSHSEQ